MGGACAGVQGVVIQVDSSCYLAGSGLSRGGTRIEMDWCLVGRSGSQVLIRIQQLVTSETQVRIESDWCLVGRSGCHTNPAACCLRDSSKKARFGVE